LYSLGSDLKYFSPAANTDRLTVAIMLRIMMLDRINDNPFLKLFFKNIINPPFKLNKLLHPNPYYQGSV
jgi:hypothetical protein